MEKLNELAAGIKSGKLSSVWVAVDSEHILAIAEAFRALEQERNALASKGLELCREAAHIYGKYNLTQMPDIDLVDYLTIQEFSDLASKIGTGGAS